MKRFHNLQCVALGLVVEISSEQSEEVVHLGIEELQWVSTSKDLTRSPRIGIPLFD
jgi:hypothetical protein